MRFLFGGFCLLLAIPSVVAPQAATLGPTHYAEDFDSLWAFVDRTYAYFDPGVHAWETVPDRYAEPLGRVRSPRDFVTLLEGVIEELRDPHAHLNTNTASSPNLIPSGTDVWASWRGERAVITAVRPGSPSDSAGLREGMEVTHVRGVPIDEAVESRLGSAGVAVSPVAREWGLLAALAGRRDEVREWGVRSAREHRLVQLPPLQGPDRAPGSPLLEWRLLPEDLGYIRVNNTLGMPSLVAAFDSALAGLKETRGLILDLRDTPSGGNTDVARGIMGRLTVTEKPYQLHRLPADAAGMEIPRSWIELVSPRGEFAYTKPLVVLVDRWTGSMGEGIAIGLDGMGRATVVGTRMAGLKGATYTKRLPNTGISITVPGERLYHIDGTPREDYVPPVEVDLTDGASTGDVILRRGLAVLRRLIAGQAPVDQKK